MHPIPATGPTGTDSGLTATGLPHAALSIAWVDNHTHSSYFGSSIIVASSISCSETAASFIPVSRICARSAYVKASYTFDYGEDSVIICVPLLKRFLSLV